MAAEASRSSGASADSYIGSLISLTSKSEIRYEGILIAINTEESSIALRNVRSFGTEGRKKDGPQLPPSDRIYEYILFRGSDIKDLQVKSSPSVQTSTPVPNDPAIIKSHYPPVVPIASTVPLSSGSGSIQDTNTESSQIGFPRPIFQGNPPLYQPGATLGSWSPSQPPPSANNVTGMYWQGVYGSLNGFQAPQQSLFRPLPGVAVPSALQQTMQYPAVNSSHPSFASNMQTSKLSESPSPLLPPLTSGIQNLSSSLHPAQSLATVADSSTSLIPNKPSMQSLPTATLSTGLPLASPLTSVLDKSVSSSSISDMSKIIHNPIVTHLSTSETVTPLVSTSTYLSEGAIPPLVTPGQLLQSGPATSMSQHPPAAEKDVEVVQVSSSELPTAQISVETEALEPILPLPVPSNQKVPTTIAHAPQSYRGGRGRGHRTSHPVTRFTEEFDFTAMNEKFNKDEVWGDLGKSNRVHENGDGFHDEEDFGASIHEIKSGYVKDDFFDSLSCDALDGGSRGERTKFSEQLRKDTETFGYMPRYRGGRGGRGLGYGGRSRGSYYGRGYGYGGRGRGHSYPSRDSYPNRAM